jgi:hypothetical protein
MSPYREPTTPPRDHSPADELVLASELALRRAKRDFRITVAISLASIVISILAMLIGAGAK